MFRTSRRLRGRPWAGYEQSMIEAIETPLEGERCKFKLSAGGKSSTRCNLARHKFTATFLRMNRLAGGRKKAKPHKLLAGS